MFRVNHLVGLGARRASSGAAIVQPSFNGADADADVTLTNDDRTMSMPGSTTGGVRSVTSAGAVKLYWELIMNNGGSASRYGIATASYTVTGAPGHDANSWAVNGDAQIYNGSGTAIRDLGTNPAQSGGSWMFAYDGVAGSLWIGDADAGTWYESGDPAAGTGAQFTGITGPVFIVAGRSSGGSTRGATLPLLASYLRSPPTGFTAGWSS